MEKYWTPLQSIPASGKDITLEDQDIWLEPMKEFGLDILVQEPVKADFFILPQEQGVLFRGRIRAMISVPCDRCASHSSITIDHSFDYFEPYPLDPPAAKEKGRKHFVVDEPVEDDLIETIDETVIRIAPHGRGIEINPASLAWEEFSLALPVKPVCVESCKGLCPVCGSNLNTNPCSCAKQDGDPRLAVLRGLTVKGK